MTPEINYPHIHIDNCNKMWITAFKNMKKVVMCISTMSKMSYPQAKLNKYNFLNNIITENYHQ